MPAPLIADFYGVSALSLLDRITGCSGLKYLVNLACHVRILRGYSG
ncbi:hypothetical protein ES703_69920 [subsurface metagenome]